MGQASLETIKNHEMLWAAIPGYADAVAIVEQRIDSILARSRAQTVRSGYSAAKAELFQNMMTLGFTVCSGLKAYGSASRRTQLFAQADFGRTQFRVGREANVINRCETMLELGRANAELLASKYNVSGADLDALKAAIEAFLVVQPKPRQSKAASSAATRDLVKLFEDVDVVFRKQLDPLMEKFRKSEPAFYNEYRSARSILRRDAKHGTKMAPVTSTAVKVSLSKAA